MELTVRERKIHVSEGGEGGAPVVLVHSSGLSSLQWRRLAEQLAPAHRTLAPDLIGYGKSQGLAEGLTASWRDDVEVVEEVVRSAGVPVHLVGHSYGGLIALAVALDLPVRSLAVYDPVAFGVLHSTGADPALHPDVDLFDPALEGTEEWCRRFVEYWQGPGTWAALSDPIRQGFLRSAKKTFQEVRSLTQDRTPHTAYTLITAPALLLTGSRTPAAARAVIDVLGAALPHARVEVVEGAGHMGPMSHADAVNALIAAHIDAS